jgi:hypothetical protein
MLAAATALWEAGGHYYSFNNETQAWFGPASLAEITRGNAFKSMSKNAEQSERICQPRCLPLEAVSILSRAHVHERSPIGLVHASASFRRVNQVNTFAKPR